MKEPGETGDTARLQKERELGFSWTPALFRQNERYSRFIIITKTIQFPTEHAGQLASPTDRLKFHPTIGLSRADTDLLQVARSTWKYINKHDKGKVCPHLLFLDMNPPDYPDVPDETLRRSEVFKLNEKLYPGHFLYHYSTMFAKEKQFKTISLEFAAHGNSDGLGASMFFAQTTSIDARLEPELFAELLLRVLTDERLLLDGRNLIERFNFNITIHSCNSAYAGYMSDDALEEKKRRVLQDSYIGKVAVWIKENYPVFSGEISGFRGYYSTLLSGGGAVVSSTNDDSESKYSQYNAENARFKIRITKTEPPALKSKKTSVSNNKIKTLEVTLPILVDFEVLHLNDKVRTDTTNTPPIVEQQGNNGL